MWSTNHLHKIPVVSLKNEQNQSKMKSRGYLWSIGTIHSKEEFLEKKIE